MNEAKDQHGDPPGSQHDDPPGDPPRGAPPPIARCLGIARNATKAAVFVISRDSGTVVRKQLQSARHGPLQRIGRFLLRREAKMLRVLAPTGLVPRVLGSGDDWLETEYVRGETVASRRKLGISREEAARLRAALTRFHESGYAHGDLGRRDMLLTESGGVAILDVATAVGPGCPPLLGPLVLPFARRRDRYRLEETIRKARERHNAHDHDHHARPRARRKPPR